MPSTPYAPRSPRLIVRTAVGAAALALALAGCGAGEPASSSSGSASAAPPASSTGTEVQVEMKEFNLELSQQELSPGTYTFKADNEGTFPHTITINGPGVDNKSAGGPLQAGQSGELTVTLQPGTYEMWCPVGNHRGKGMVTSITVA